MNRKDERHGPWTVAELEAMPTIHSGQYANLKMDNGEERVWLSRMTAADGEIYAIAHERLIDGRWETMSEYAPVSP